MLHKVALLLQDLELDSGEGPDGLVRVFGHHNVRHVLVADGREGGRLLQQLLLKDVVLAKMRVQISTPKDPAEALKANDAAVQPAFRVNLSDALGLVQIRHQVRVLKDDVVFVIYKEIKVVDFLLEHGFVLH